MTQCCSRSSYYSLHLPYSIDPRILGRGAHCITGPCLTLVGRFGREGRRVYVFRAGFPVAFWYMFGGAVSRATAACSGAGACVPLLCLRPAAPAFQVLGSVLRSPEFLAATGARENWPRGVRVFKLVVLQVAGPRVRFPANVAFVQVFLRTALVCAQETAAVRGRGCQR